MRLPLSCHEWLNFSQKPQFLDPSHVLVSSLDQVETVCQFRFPACINIIQSVTSFFQQILIMHSILCVLCCISLVSAYHNGAGLGACGDLTPQHGATAQTTNPPYNLTVTGKQYTGSGTMDGKSHESVPFN